MPGKRINVLFVCSGNTCRSVMAQGFLERIWEKYPDKKVEIRASSAGVAAVDDLEASPQALEALREEGIDLRHHRSRKVDEELIVWADYIFTMTEGHKKALLAFFPEAKEKVWLLGEFVTGEKGWEIPDPYGEGIEIYRFVAGKLKDLIEKALEKLNNV